MGEALGFPQGGVPTAGEMEVTSEEVGLKENLKG